MQNRLLRNSATFAALIIVILASGLIDSLPWWFFIIPVLLFGMITQVMEWTGAGFSIGFSAGFLVWFGGNFYYGFVFGGATLQKIGHIYSLPGYVTLLLSGLPGGILAGLAFYVGKNILRPGENKKAATE
jgi:hypothetical protein